MVARRRFTREFKISAVQLVSQRRMSIREAADSLGVSVSTLRSWIAKYSSDPLVGGVGGVGGVKSAEGLQSENRRLREENARLRMEREILKKATAFFAREPG